MISWSFQMESLPNKNDWQKLWKTLEKQIEARLNFQVFLETRSKDES